MREFVIILAYAELMTGKKIKMLENCEIKNVANLPFSTILAYADYIFF